MIDIKDRSWAEDDLITENLSKKQPSILRILFSRFNKAKHTLLRNGLFIPYNQDEFKKASPYCTAYAAMSQYTRQTGQVIPRNTRAKFIAYCLKNEIIYDTEERSWGSTIKTAHERHKFTHREPKLNFKSDMYILEMWTRGANRILKKWHAMVTSFMINRWFVHDRRDNNILDGMVHSWDTYNGHAIIEVRYKNVLAIINNYGTWMKNFVMKWLDKISLWYNPEYHRQYGVFMNYKRKI